MASLLQHSRMLHLYDLIRAKKEDQILREVSFLADSQPDDIEILRDGVNVCCLVHKINSSVLQKFSLSPPQWAIRDTTGAIGKPESPMQLVGQFLKSLLQGYTLPQRSFIEPGASLRSFPPKFNITPHFTQPLYSCPTYSQMDFICLILNICSGIPEAYQVLRCQETTMEEELSLFLKRAESCTRHHSQYFMLDVNKLPYKLQEVCDSELCSYNLGYCHLVCSIYIWSCSGLVSNKTHPF